MSAVFCSPEDRKLSLATTGVITCFIKGSSTLPGVWPKVQGASPGSELQPVGVDGGERPPPQPESRNHSWRGGPAEP